MSKLKSKISKVRQNILGSRFSKKYVVLESDDWGAVRMSSKQAFKSLLKAGYPVDKCAFNINDGLESNSDLNKLFDILSNVKNQNGKNPIITFNHIGANPDFAQISDSKFSEYHYEKFTETLKKYPDHDKVFDLYGAAISEKIMDVQFHGREHVNVVNWLDNLQDGNKMALDAFKYDMVSTFPSYQSNCKIEFLDAFAIYDNNYEFVKNSIIDGLTLFQHYWNKPSVSVIAPCYTWCERVEGILKNAKVEALQGGYVQVKPTTSGFKSIRHYTGEVNSLNQVYLTRNCSFEPATDPSKDWVSQCMNDIQIAFMFRKPAIINTHRLNFISSLNIKNEESLFKFKLLLEAIVKKWPDVEFISSEQLVGIMKYNNSKLCAD